MLHHLRILGCTYDEPTVRRMLSAKGLQSLFLEDELTALLHAGFRPDEIKANVYDIYRFSRMNDLVNEMDILEKAAKGKDNPKGWIILQLVLRGVWDIQHAPIVTKFCTMGATILHSTSWEASYRSHQV